MPRKVHVFRFNSLAEMVETASKEAPHVGHRSSRAAERGAGIHGFYGSESFDAAVSLAFGGWVEGAARVQERRAAINKKVEAGAYRVEYARRGPGALSMNRVNQGHPRPYAVVVPAEGRPKVVRLFVNTGANARVEAISIERRGAAICSLVDALEANGRTVEIVAYTAADSVRGNQQVRTFCTIKRAGARLNMPTVAFALAHPSMHRRIVFGVREQLPPTAWRYFEGTYGGTVDICDEIPADAVNVPSLSGRNRHWMTDADAAQWVKETARAQGVELHDS